MKRILKGIPLEEAKDKENKSIYPTISEAFDNYVKYQEMKPDSKNNHRQNKLRFLGAVRKISTRRQSNTQ